MVCNSVDLAREVCIFVNSKVTSGDIRLVCVVVGLALPQWRIGWKVFTISKSLVSHRTKDAFSIH